MLKIQVWTFTFTRQPHHIDIRCVDKHRLFADTVMGEASILLSHYFEHIAKNVKAALQEGRTPPETYDEKSWVALLDKGQMIGQLELQV